MEALEYIPIAPEATLWRRFWNRLAGLRDRRGVYHRFLKDNNIDPRNPYSRNVTRNKYLLRTHHMERLTDLRYQSIRREFVKVARKQKSVATQYSIVGGSLAKEKKILTEITEELEATIRQLKEKNLTSLQKAHLQGDRGTLEASVANQTDTVNKIEGDMKVLQSLYEENLKAFRKVARDTQNIYTILLNEYVRYAGRPLHTIGFTNYDAELPDIEEIITSWEKELTDDI